MNRRKIREHLFKMIFTIEFDGIESFEESCNSYLDDLNVEEDKGYILNKAMDVFKKRDELDHTINGHAQNWTTDRMPKVDVAILRVAVYEIIYDTDIPNAVAINEAVELAKTYGNEQSFSFVNGILAKLA